jgi:hypothetical protein
MAVCFLSYIHFEKIKKGFLCVMCVCTHYLFFNYWTNLCKTWNVYHGTWPKLNGVIKKHVPSVILTLQTLRRKLNFAWSPISSFTRLDMYITRQLRPFQWRSSLIHDISNTNTTASQIFEWIPLILINAWNDRLESYAYHATQDHFKAYLINPYH